MAVRFRKPAIKFLGKSNPEEVENIRSAIKAISIAIDEQGSFLLTK